MKNKGVISTSLFNVSFVLSLSKDNERNNLCSYPSTSSGRTIGKMHNILLQGIFSLLILHSFFVQQRCSAANDVFGSYDIVLLQTSTPSLSGGNNALVGFTVFEAGFTLADSAASVVWDCYYPVQSVITLNGGTVTLTEDFVMSTTATFADGGTFEGGYKVVLPDIIGTFNLPGTFVFNNITLVCNSPVSITGNVTFQGQCVIEGQTNLIDLSSGSIVVDSNSRLHVKNTTLDGITSGAITNSDSTSNLELDDVVWIQDGSYSFTIGNLDIVNNDLFRGPQIFSYESTGTCTIYGCSTMFFDSGMTFSYDTASRNALEFDDRTATLQFYETAIYSSIPGLQLTKGIVVVEGTCPVFNNATSESDGISIGDGTFAHNVTLKILSESGFEIKSGYLVYKNV